jgi:hypothetical protein
MEAPDRIETAHQSLTEANEIAEWRAAKGNTTDVARCQEYSLFVARSTVSHFQIELIRFATRVAKSTDGAKDNKKRLTFI